jgi:hypothetical protein
MSDEPPRPVARLGDAGLVILSLLGIVLLSVGLILALLDWP